MPEGTVVSTGDRVRAGRDSGVYRRLCSCRKGQWWLQKAVFMPEGTMVATGGRVRAGRDNGGYRSPCSCRKRQWWLQEALFVPEGTMVSTGCRVCAGGTMVYTGGRVRAGRDSDVYMRLCSCRKGQWCQQEAVFVPEGQWCLQEAVLVSEGTMVATGGRVRAGRDSGVYRKPCSCRK